jgi:hypothetical protein
LWVHSQGRRREECRVRKTWKRHVVGALIGARASLGLLLVLLAGCTWDLVGFTFTPCNEMHLQTYHIRC